MADADIGWAHATAIHALIEAAVSYQVFIGEPNAPDPDSGQAGALDWPHLILWPPPVTRPTITLAGYGGEGRTITQVTGVGRSVREVLASLDRASEAVHRKRPTIAGRKCSLIRVLDETMPPPQLDPQVSTPDHPIYFSFIQAELHSAPVPQEP